MNTLIHHRNLFGAYSDFLLTRENIWVETVRTFARQPLLQGTKKGVSEGHTLMFGWALTDSNRRPSACKADALNQLS